MNLDIRYPLGMIFVAIGASLAVFGLITRGSAIYAVSEGMNINLIWGVLMLVVGAVLLGMAKYAALHPAPPEEVDPDAPTRPSFH